MEPLVEELGVGVADWAAVEDCHWSFDEPVGQIGLGLYRPLVRTDYNEQVM
jgi:hypothetical protein